MSGASHAQHRPSSGLGKGGKILRIVTRGSSAGGTNSSNDFKRGDLVWGKVRGYSWWPAIIGEIIKESKDRKYRVDFIGDNTH